MALFQALYHLLWGDLVTIPVARWQHPGTVAAGDDPGARRGVFHGAHPLLALPPLSRDGPVTLSNNQKTEHGLSGVQALIVSTACRVGMGNLVAVAAFIVLRKNATVRVLDRMVPIMRPATFSLRCSSS